MNTRICATCKIEKNETEFHFRDKKANRRSSWCKDCSKSYTAKHYDKRKDQYIAAAVVSNRKRREKLRRIKWEYLKGRSCIDCGEKDPVVLDFDHRENKIESISRLISQFASIEKIKEEMDKCDIRCANCHRRRTAKQFCWFETENGIEKSNRKRRIINTRPIKCIETGKIFQSAAEAGRELKISPSNVRAVLNGTYQQTHGLRFVFV